MIELSAQLVRGYKGAAASIILLFLIERRPLAQGYLRRYTGYPNEAISDAVDMLRDAGILVETGRYTWSLLTDGLRQLPIMATEPEALPEKILPELGADFLAANPHACMQDSDSIESDEEIPACMPDAEKTAPGNLAEALHVAGFREPGFSRLARMPGLTARVVRYHVAHAPSLGAALYRIERGWRVPEEFEPERGKGNPYRGGKYADFVQH